MNYISELQVLFVYVLEFQYYRINFPKRKNKIKIY